MQVALTALGHQTPATGFFGPITRAMIADWQKTQGLPSSGFLDASQLATLCAKTAPAEAEAGLNLSERDHKRVQLALTALGHQTPATGYFGPITRAMIADWQKTQGLPPSGFLDAAQLAALYAQAPRHVRSSTVTLPLRLRVRDPQGRRGRPRGALGNFRS